MGPEPSAPPSMMRTCLGLPTTLGSMTAGFSCPAMPALMVQEPLSITMGGSISTNFVTVGSNGCQLIISIIEATGAMPTTEAQRQKFVDQPTMFVR